MHYRSLEAQCCSVPSLKASCLKKPQAWLLTVCHDVLSNTVTACDCYIWFQDNWIKGSCNYNKNSLIKVKLYEAKGECCLNLIWMTLQQYSAWPSVSTEAKQAFDVAHEHAVDSKAISIHEKKTLLRFRSHQRWGNWVRRSKEELKWQQWWHKKWRSLIKLWWPFSPWVYSSGRAQPFTRQKKWQWWKWWFLGLYS